MAAVLTWVRLDLKRRWRSLVALALIIGLAGAVVMTALAGASRGMSALDRLINRTEHPVDAMVLANTPQAEMTEAGWSWSDFDELPYVVSRSGFILAFGSGIKELGDFDASDSADFPHADDNLFFEYDKPVIYEGRLYDPERIEMVVTPDFVKEHGYGVGDELTLRLASAEQADNGQETTAYEDLEGPEMTVPIVGVIRSSWLIDDGVRTGGFSLSPGIVAKYPASFYGTTGENVIVNSQFALQNGAADIEKLRKDIKRITGRSDIDVFDWKNETARYNHTLNFEGRSLQAFGLAALIASVLLIGQAISRLGASEASELTAARALGMTPRQVAAAAATTAGIAAAVGSVIAIAGSIVASRWFPIGLAGHAEPDPGIDLDWLVLALGLLTTFVVACGAAALGAFVSMRSTQPATAPVATSVSRALANASAPVPAVVGARFALERGRGAASIPVRPAIAGAIAGILGVTAVLVFSHGIDDAVDNPERFGETFQLGAFGGFGGQDFVPPEVLTEAITGLDDVTGFVDAPLNVVNIPDGGGSAELFGYRTGEKPLKTVILDGRMPEAADEVALSPGTQKALDTEVGKKLTVETNTGSHTLTVVGSAFVPPGPHNDYNHGGWLSADGYDAVFGGPDQFKFHLYFASTKESLGTGTKLAENINAQLVKANPAFAEAGGEIVFDPKSEGLGSAGTRDQLASVQVFPIALAGFLAVLAVGTVGHALATAVRRRAHDIAVLRAVGLTPGQSRWIVLVQATVLMLVGLAFGVPLGIAAGRTIWRGVAEFTPVAYVPPTALIALLLVAPSALLISYVVASWPAWRASRLQVATILRAE